MVAPLAGAWIETRSVASRLNKSTKSPLSQGRGSKLVKPTMFLGQIASPLSQGRGSKHRARNAARRPWRVAPLAGAWIETARAGVLENPHEVAPLAGAWIETSHAVARCCFCGRPSRRGVDRNDEHEMHVAVGAGRPSRRGVDRNSPSIARAIFPATSRPSRRGVDRNRAGDGRCHMSGSSPLSQGRGSKRFSGHEKLLLIERRPSRRGVDRNGRAPVTSSRHVRVAPLAGAWIETPSASNGPTTTRSSPLSQGRGSKPVDPLVRAVTRYVAPLAGAWIETS